MVLYKLTSNNLLDDALFAREWTRSRIRKYGKQRIIMELRQKGISSEDITMAIDTIDEDEELQAAVVAAKKVLSHCRQEENPYKKK